MATQLQIRRGTTAQMNAFTGAEGELAVNTSTDTVHVHDGATAGGFALAKADGSNIGTYAGSFTTLAASGAVTLSSTLAVTGTATMGGLTVDLADNAGVLLQSPNDSSTAFLKFGDATSADSGSISYDHFSDALRFKTTNTTRMILANNGDISFYNSAGTSQSLFWDASAESLGIGTSSPSRALATKSSSVTVANFESTSATAGFISFSDSNTTNDVTVRAGAVGDNLVLQAGGTERMRIDSSGNLLVGTTDVYPADNNVAGHSLTAVGQLQSSVSGYAAFVANRKTSDGAIALFKKDGATVGSIGVDNNDNFQIGATTSGHAGLYFGNGSVAPMAGNSRVQDTVDLGNATYRWKDLYLSGVANVGSIVQTGSTSSLVASFENTNTSGYGMRITTYSSGVEYALAVDSYGGGYSRDFVIGVNGYIYSPPTYALTTASAANMHISSAGGLLFRSTSSARYKNTITDATHGLTELLTLRPVTYKGNNDGDTVFGGLIAEEVHDAGLTEFVQYNEEDQPDALAYGNMVSLCIKAIQELKEELNTATARITELENN